MEKGDPPSLPGSRQLNLKKSFKLGIRSLLTTCSKEEIFKAFEGFSKTEQEALHQLFIQVITSLHENLKEEFELLCLETQVGTILDTVEQLVEEQSLDSLFSDKTAVGDVCQDLASLKKNEIKHLMIMLQKGEESKRIARERVERLKKEVQGLPGAADLLRRSRAGILDDGKSKQLTP
ncbi:uncharacterized protein LOC127806835 [Diospyros lotus]|uniref:uncharacterized protein LOC127806835 n=1 Tax=Diospyros lotus TaxID=55363 RepID=UPI002253FCCB|nr:uncharacterized protein LOC127806835 [Diospyros lotus]